MRSLTTRLFWGCILFAMFGLCVEIAFTGLFAGWSGSFRGQVSLLMIPVYATAYAVIWALLRLSERLGWTHFAVRIPIALVVITALEWGFGAGYAAMGLTPWHYDHGWASDWSGGAVTLYYLPAWTLFAAVVVHVWRVVHAVSPHAHAAARAEVAPLSRYLAYASRTDITSSRAAESTRSTI